jgi:hypothetical protein
MSAGVIGPPMTKTSALVSGRDPSAPDGIGGGSRRPTMKLLLRFSSKTARSDQTHRVALGNQGAHRRRPPTRAETRGPKPMSSGPPAGLTIKSENERNAFELTGHSRSVALGKAQQ